MQECKAEKIYMTILKEQQLTLHDNISLYTHVRVYINHDFMGSDNHDSKKKKVMIMEPPMILIN